MSNKCHPLFPAQFLDGANHTINCPYLEYICSPNQVIASKAPLASASSERCSQRTPTPL